MKRLWWSLALLTGCASAPPLVRTAPTPELPHAHEAGIISTDTLAAWLERGPVRVLDVRSDLFTFLRGHLPAAQFLHTETLRATERGIPGQLLSAAWYSPLFARLGLAEDIPVVVYSAGESANIDATFAAYLLAGAGHPRVYVLDGGSAKWELEHRPLVREYTEVPTPGWPSTRRFAPEHVELDQFRGLRERSDVVVVDARPLEQFTGDAGSQMRRGHIPGAISHYWADDLERVGFGLVWRAPEVLRRSYEAQGIRPEHDIIIYCNSTTEASHVWWTLHVLLGYPSVRIYVGAWTEWAGRADLPIATGR